jgi:hypothetical protein
MELRIGDLTVDELALLEEVVREREPKLELLLGMPDHVITDEESGQLTNAVGDELVEVGMDDTWTPNDRGRRLDRLLARVNSVRTQ